MDDGMKLEMSLLTFLGVFQLIVPAIHGQSLCPSQNPFGVLCGDMIPPGAWRSEITGSGSSDSNASLSWQADPAIPPNEDAYRIAIRNRDQPGAQFSLRRITRADNFTVMRLMPNTRYEVLICYENITREILEIDSGFIEQCGYCRTCFRTEEQSDFINITSATSMSYSTPTGPDVDIFTCRALGHPSPINIRWRAEDITVMDGTLAVLSNRFQGVIISDSVEGAEEVSELRLSDATFRSPFCRVSNDGDLMVSQRNFEVIGYINVTNATVTSTTLSSGVEFNVFTCEVLGDPLPINISWLATSNNAEIVGLINNAKDVFIVDSMRGDSVRSELMLLSDGIYSSPLCRINNGNGFTVDQQDFIDIDEDTSTTDEDMGISKSTVAIPVYAIVILAIMPALMLPVIIIGSIIIYRRCHKVKRRTSLFTGIDIDMSRVSTGDIDGTLVKQGADANAILILKQRLPEDMFIAPSDINVSLVIGQGEFGVIYKAYMHCKGRDMQETVAVKTLKGIFATSSDIGKATEEILKMCHFDHPNVMSLIGVCIAPSEQGQSSVGPSIIMPFMAKGSLLDYLRKQSEDFFAANEDEIPNVRKALMIICQQIAKGMAYLASLKFVHRDLAARNCLMDSHGTIKVSDFGLTEDIYTRNYFRQAKDGAKLPLKWMALESIKLGVFSEKTDVWSYGVTCWEVFNGGIIPYSGFSPCEILETLEEGTRLAKPKNPACCPNMYKMMQSCWEEKQDSRPTFAQICVTMDNFLTSIADYVDLRGLRTDLDKSEFGSEPNVLTLHVPSEPNDYSIAGV